MTNCSSDAVKQFLHNYASQCGPDETEDHWDFGGCPLVPDKLRIHESVDPSDSKQQNELLLHGLGAVFAISLCSTFGAVIVPCFKDRPQQFAFIMLYLMALAVSALSGAATMVLIPEGIGLMDCDELRQPNLTVCLGILTFFVIRRILHAWTGHDDIFTHALEEPVDKNEMRSRTTTIASSALAKQGPTEVIHCGESESCSHIEATPLSTGTSASLIKCGKGEACAKKKKVALENIMNMKSVGWMTLIGDGAHNFLDGIAMGTTFMHSGKQKGWQVSIAILAEEFPHELGDYAVLLKAGLTPCEAIICNIISGMTCLIGFFVGWKFQDFMGQSVFSWMGGVFLFISLACMLPEVESTIGDMNRQYKTKKLMTTVVAIAGFISGYAVVYSAGAFISFKEV